MIPVSLISFDILWCPMITISVHFAKIVTDLSKCFLPSLNEVCVYRQDPRIIAALPLRTGVLKPEVCFVLCNNQNIIVLSRKFEMVLFWFFHLEIIQVQFVAIIFLFFFFALPNRWNDNWRTTFKMILVCSSFVDVDLVLKFIDVRCRHRNKSRSLSGLHVLAGSARPGRVSSVLGRSLWFLGSR